MQFDKAPNSNWLPSFPTVAIRVLELFAQESVAIIDIANEIKLDPVLTAKLLDVANSPLYRSKREIATLEHAISWLGKSEVAGLVLSLKMEAYANESNRETKYYNQFWRQSFVQGCAMARIAESTGRIAKGEAYVCGLLLDFGMLLILDGYPAGYAKILDESKELGIPLHEVEMEKLSLSHANVGKDLLENMGLPARYGTAAGLHTVEFDDLSNHEDEEHFDLIVASLVSAAMGDFFCRNNQGTSLGKIEKLCREYLGMQESDIEWLMETVRNDIDEKAHLYSIDANSVSPIAQLVGHANSQIETTTAPAANEQEASSVQQENRVLRNLVASLQERVCKDSVTGIYNRDYFTGVLNERINSNNFKADKFALLVVDIDKFKSINDGFGHLEGDQAIKWTAQFLDSFFERGLVARFGGDEFVALVDTESQESFSDRLDKLCSDINSASDESAAVNEIKISAGAVFCNVDKPNSSLPVQLFDLADKAMYNAKGAGGNQGKVVSIHDIPDSWTGSVDAVVQTPSTIPSTAQITTTTSPVEAVT